jgi:hypothetical protein
MGEVMALDAAERRDVVILARNVARVEQDVPLVPLEQEGVELEIR